jgi:hypothetical protein
MELNVRGRNEGVKILESLLLNLSEIMEKSRIECNIWWEAQTPEWQESREGQEWKQHLSEAAELVKEIHQLADKSPK